LSFGFTYQGRLLDGGNPANGLYDLQFELFDSAPAAIGPVVQLPDQPVTDGLFTVQLDFGDVFDGRRLWLQIGVKPGGSADPYTILSERQELTAAPYALYALDVGVNYAKSSSRGGPALDLTCAGCVNSTDIQDGTVLFADIGQNGCLQGQVTKWNGAGWSCSNVYARTVIVSPVGTPLENGGALLTALEGIADAAEGNPYLLKIEPGRYDLGSQSLTMQEWVDVEGSGEVVTTITASGSSSSGTGTVLGADNTELRFLTVENTGGSTWAIAIYNDNTSPRLTHLTASAWGGAHYNCAVTNSSESSSAPTPTMVNVTAIAKGGETARGVDNGGSAPTMNDVTARGYGATDTNYGIYNDAMASFAMTNVTAVASGGSTATAIRNAYCSTIMTNVTARAFNGSSHNWAVYNQHSSALMSNVTATAVLTDSRGLLNTGAVSTPTLVFVDQSRINATTNTIENGYGVVTLVGASRLAGGPVTGTGITCAGVYDENYTFYNSACP
jgi:hypothetical protein